MSVAVAIIGTGNIGCDLMIKIYEKSSILKMQCFVGIDPQSDGLKKAEDRGLATTFEGIEGLVKHPNFDEIKIVFDASSAKAHCKHARILAEYGKKVVDLTPAALGPFVVPVANLEEGLEHQNVNMVTCGGQATIPILKAISNVGHLVYGEIIASISSRSAGPGTRANIDEFTRTTARAIEVIAGADRGKAIIVLNPAEPPLVMRDTVYGLVESYDQEALHQEIVHMVKKVQSYVPGYRLTQDPVFEQVSLFLPEMQRDFTGLKVSVFLEVEGAGDYLPKYAGNLDIMTAAALKMGEEIAKQMEVS